MPWPESSTIEHSNRSEGNSISDRLDELDSLFNGVSAGISQRVEEARANPLATATEVGGSMATGFLLSRLQRGSGFGMIASRVICGAMGLSLLGEASRHLLGLTGRDKFSVGESTGRWLLDTTMVSAGGFVGAGLGKGLSFQMGAKSTSVLSDRFQLAHNEGGYTVRLEDSMSLRSTADEIGRDSLSTDVPFLPGRQLTIPMVRRGKSGIVDLVNCTADAPEARLYQKVRPAIVRIHAGPPLNNEFAIGTGFFVSSDGLFVTNVHVALESTDIHVDTIDGRIHRARLSKLSPVADLALLRIIDVEPGETFATVPVTINEETTLIPASKVVLLGHTDGNENLHVHPGRFIRKAAPSDLNEQLNSPNWADTNSPVILSTEVRAPGTSGSPLFNLETGNLLGIHKGWVWLRSILSCRSTAVPSVELYGLLNPEYSRGEMLDFLKSSVPKHRFYKTTPTGSESVPGIP